MANMLPKREEGKKETQWRLEDMYASNEAWEADAALLSEKIEKLGSFKGRLGEGAKVFLEAFRLHDETNMLFEKVYVYANQRHHEDTGNSFYQALSGRAQTLMVALSQAEAYMTPEILALPEETVEAYFAEEPELELYRHACREIVRFKGYFFHVQQRGYQISHHLGRGRGAHRRDPRHLHLPHAKPGSGSAKSRFFLGV